MEGRKEGRAPKADSSKTVEKSRRANSANMSSCFVVTLLALVVLDVISSAWMKRSTSSGSSVRFVAPDDASFVARPFFASRAPLEMRPRSNLWTYSSRLRTA